MFGKLYAESLRERFRSALAASSSRNLSARAHAIDTFIAPTTTRSTSCASLLQMAVKLCLCEFRTARYSARFIMPWYSKYDVTKYKTRLCIFWFW